MQQAALAPACMRRPFPSKWCRAQHTVPHQAAYPRPGPAAQHRRLFMKAVMNCVYPLYLFVACLCVHTGVFLCLTVCSRGGEGGLQAASYYGLWWSVVLSSQWQLTHYCEVSQRFVRIESMPCSCYKKCVMRYNFVFLGSGGRERSMKGSFHIFLFCVAWNDMAFMCIEPETSKGIFFFSWCAHYHVAMVCGDQNSLPHFILLL